MKNYDDQHDSPRGMFRFFQQSGVLGCQMPLDSSRPSIAAGRPVPDSVPGNSPPTPVEDDEDDLIEDDYEDLICDICTEQIDLHGDCACTIDSEDDED